MLSWHRGCPRLVLLLPPFLCSHSGWRGRQLDTARPIPRDADSCDNHCIFIFIIPPTPLFRSAFIKNK